MTRLEEMVISAIPSARPKIDFDFQTDENGHAYLSKWDEIILGPKPPMKALHDHFMNYLKNKQRKIPTINMEDPCPWLCPSNEPAKARSIEHEVIQKNERYVLAPNGALLHYKN